MDNVGKLFLASQSMKSPYVFRCSCELHAPVNRKVLDEALEITVRAFPHFQVVIHRGVFWSYFEGSPATPVTQDTAADPDILIDPNHTSRLLYQVSCIDRRIDLDIFHGMTDGTGAMLFLRLIAAAYLSLAHPDAPGMDVAFAEMFAALPAFEADGFVKNYDDSVVASAPVGTPAYQMKGKRNRKQPMQILRGLVPVAEMLKQSRARNVSVTELFVALYIDAIHSEMARVDEMMVYHNS